MFVRTRNSGINGGHKKNDRINRTPMSAKSS